MKNIRKPITVIAIMLLSIIVMSGCSFLNTDFTSNDDNEKQQATEETATIDDLNSGDYSDLVKLEYDRDNLYVVVNDNKVDSAPNKTETYIHLSELDELGRCGSAEAVLGPETLPDNERESIGQVKPSGWPTNGLKNNKYDFVDGKYLYNRCHLIAFSLSGLNADKRNLITGTRTLNIKGMWEFEEDVLYYIKNTGNHVYYKVTPIFKDDELVARGVLMEAKSIEDNSLEFCVYCFNVEPGVYIDYRNGDNYAEKFD